MKKSYFVLFFFLIVTNSIYSQKEFVFGINAGMTYSNAFTGLKSYYLSNFELKEIEATEYDIGFKGGVSIEYYFIKNLSVKTEINFERKKFISYLTVRHGFEEIFRTQIQTNFDYITFPIMLKFDFGKSKNFYTSNGVFLAKQINSSSIIDGNKVDSFESSKKEDIGLVFGLGIKIPINKNNFTIELRDNLGLKNIFPNENNSANSNSYNFILGYSF